MDVRHTARLTPTGAERVLGAERRLTCPAEVTDAADAAPRAV